MGRPFSSFFDHVTLDRSGELPGVLVVRGTVTGTSMTLTSTSGALRRKAGRSPSLMLLVSILAQAGTAAGHGSTST
jgi:hypothetical protein